MSKSIFVIVCELTVLFNVIFAQVNINTICIHNFTCVPFTECLNDGSIRYPCNDIQTRVCCPPSLLLDFSEKISGHGIGKGQENRRVLPAECGVVSSADRITGGQFAAIGQFPWMVLLGYRQAGLSIAQFLCGGSIITNDFILTAAHCINIDARLQLSVVRLGELNLETEIDCEQDAGEKVCADRHVDVPVDKVFAHEGFDMRSLDHDIALIKLRTRIPKYTDYIQPICLPVMNNDLYQLTPNNKLMVSGWGKTSSANVGGAVHLQYAEVRLWSLEQCNSTVPLNIRPIKESQICANDVRRQDACKGDSGGPLFNSTIINGDIRSYQVGVVSFASAQICGNPELPSIYTKVEYYMDWIMNKIT